MVADQAVRAARELDAVPAVAERAAGAAASDEVVEDRRPAVLRAVDAVREVGGDDVLGGGRAAADQGAGDKGEDLDAVFVIHRGGAVRVGADEAALDDVAADVTASAGSIDSNPSTEHEAVDCQAADVAVRCVLDGEPTRVVGTLRAVDLDDRRSGVAGL